MTTKNGHDNDDSADGGDHDDDHGADNQDYVDDGGDDDDDDININFSDFKLKIFHT